MASLSNINGLFDVHSTGAILFSTSHGTSGQILRSNGNAAPTWVAASTVIGGPYLPLTGGTLSGPLSGTSATFSGNVLLGSNNDIPMDASASGQLMVDGVGYQGAIALDDQAMYIYHNSSGRNLVLGTNETARLTIGGSGNSIFSGTLTVAGGVVMNGNQTVQGNLTVDGTLSGTSATFSGNVTVGANADGQDVLFLGETSGAYFKYDASEDGVVIVAPTDEVALGIRVVGGAQPTVPQFTVGEGCWSILRYKSRR